LASSTPVPSAVSTTELGYVDGVTSAIQTQDDSKLATATASSTYQTKAAAGLVLLNTTSFSGVSSQIISLGTSYTNYRVILSHTGTSVDSNLLLRLSLSGTPATSANYNGACAGILTTTGASNNLLGAGVTSFQYATSETGASNEWAGFVFDFIDLGAARNNKITSTGITVNSAGAVTTWTGAALHDVATAYNEIQFFPSSGTFSGRAVAYGYGV